jgi:hypothetical protein
MLEQWCLTVPDWTIAQSAFYSSFVKPHSWGMMMARICGEFRKALQSGGPVLFPFDVRKTFMEKFRAN